MSVRWIRPFVGIAIVATFWSDHPAGADPGDLDPTFGSGGVVTTAVGDYAEAAAVAVQGDGKLVVAGYTSTFDPETHHWLTARYAADGTLDSTFGSGGLVLTAMGASAGARALVIQPNGKLLVGGATTSMATGTDFALARYETDGSLDTSFGTSGVLTSELAPYNSAVSALTIQPDDNVLALGSTDALPSGGSRLARYGSDGSLDTTFGPDGNVLLDFDARAMALQPDGKIVVAGTDIDPATGVRVGIVTRLASDGSVDPSFGAAGRALITIGPLTITRDKTIINGAYHVSSLVVRGDGSLIVGGLQFLPLSTGALVVAALTSDGSFDANFGDGGIARVANGFEPYELLLTGDGDIIAAAVNVLRMRPNGVIDPGLGACGRAWTHVSGNLTNGDFTLQDDGKLVAVGHIRPLNGNALLAVSRLEGGVGDVTGEPDIDADDMPDACDVCPSATDAMQEDTDIDAIGDACDPCTNIADRFGSDAKLTFKHLDTPGGDDTLKLKTMLHQVPGTPTIDPIANGLQLWLDHPNYGSIELTVPAGAYDPVTKVGWKPNPKLTAFTYSNKAGHVTKVKLNSSTNVPGSYKLSAQAIAGSYADFPPTRIVVSLRPSDPLARQCNEVGFGCTFNASGSTRTCK